MNISHDGYRRVQFGLLYTPLSSPPAMSMLGGMRIDHWLSGAFD